jgi:hypothetical protein
LLTPYDEFPVHQATRPFSHIPSSDTAWDDGYFFGLLNPDEELFLFTGMRVSPNTDMIGGYVGVCIRGRQYTTRFSRIWREAFDTHIGPLRYAFKEPFKDIHLTLADNASDLAMDLHWLGLAPAHEEEHHLATNRGRRSTDQTRYSQIGTAEGWIEFEGKRIEVSKDNWTATRDHSWGIYADRPPFKNQTKLLPPAEKPAVRRALRIWIPFKTSTHTGFYHFHEDEDGNQLHMNDVFGTPFDGAIDHGWEKPRLRLVSGTHELEFLGDSRSLKSGTILLTDENGGRWQHDIEVAGYPWTPLTIGYHAGSWKDGGAMSSYHGEGVQQEWDEFDVSNPPFEHTLYQGPTIKGLSGNEHIARITSTDPDGNVSEGCGQLELIIDGAYRPYGFE